VNLVAGDDVPIPTFPEAVFTSSSGVEEVPTRKPPHTSSIVLLCAVVDPTAKPSLKLVRYVVAPPSVKSDSRKPSDEVAIWVQVLPAPPMRSWFWVIEERPVPPLAGVRALVRFNVPIVDDAMVVVARVEVPVTPRVPVRVRFGAASVVPLKVKTDESMRRPPVDT
jgi:hypothetical protein